MKKLAITSVAVLIALIGFTAVLCLLPGGNCCGERDGCEMHDGKCPHEKGMSGGKCSHDKDGCEMEEGKCGGEKRMVKEWKDADGKMHKEVKVTIGDEGCGGDYQYEKGACQMGNGGQNGCCCCCMMMMNGHGEMMNSDSMKMDTVRVKVRGKL
jgi:hypothetical protein